VAQEVEVQLPAQTPLASLAHRLLAHATGDGVTQEPEPLHVDAAVEDPSVQLAAWHTVELPGIRQAVAFVPSHCPLHFPDPVQAARVPWGSP
jgi:hypothetical protein